MTGWWLIVCLAVSLIGVTKSGFGSGVGLMIVPMTAVALSHTPFGEKAALGLLLPLLIAGDVIAVYQYRRLASLRLLKQLLPGTAVGVLLGSLLLYWIGRHRQDLANALMRLEIGAESILLVSLHWWRTLRGRVTKLLPEPLRGSLTGAFAAVSSTLAHAAGPVIALYLLPLGLDRQTYVGTSAIYFFLLNSAKLPAYAMTGQFRNANLTFTARFLPLVLLGAAAGWTMNKRINDKLFSKIVYAVTFALGWYIFIDGIAMLTSK